jgi:hypothetical protein
MLFTTIGVLGRFLVDDEGEDIGEGSAPDGDSEHETGASFMLFDAATGISQLVFVVLVPLFISRSAASASNHLSNINDF